MATRVGKYKLSKKETELSLADGGFASGPLNYIQKVTAVTGKKDKLEYLKYFSSHVSLLPYSCSFLLLIIFFTSLLLITSPKDIPFI